MQNRQPVERYGFTYIDMQGNQGLSKAYNRAIGQINLENGMLCLFDDDTNISSDYFDKVRSHASRSAADIFLPLVYDEQGLISPSIMKTYYCHHARSIEEIGENISGINSGMAIRTAVFQRYRYDENLFLDFVDHAFIRDMRRQGRRIEVMEDVTLRQRFSANTNSKESALNRFAILKKDSRYFYRGGLRAALCYSYVIAKRKARLCLQYRTLGFLFR